jgi:hypothetical protein
VFALCTAGCEHHYFQAHGALNSDGGTLGRWHEVPEGCSLAPVDGLPVGQSSTLATLVWLDPLAKDPSRERHRAAAANVPLRLTMLRAGNATVADLTMMHSDQPIRLDSRVCSSMSVSTKPGKPEFPGARPTLDGSLQLQCQVDDSHLEANLHFSGCEF